MMTPDRWRKIEEIFQTVVEQPPARRDALLTQYCGADAELRRQVESLLVEVGDDEFLQAPIKDVARSLDEPPADDWLGRQIGAYRVLELLGQGGMGAVYLAERADAEYYRQVALKVVRRGMGTHFVLSRFRHERQLLATLEHPNIAQLLDGGTTEDGWPYFVMEYIKGQPLTDYCAARSLSITERLRLFLPVCAAVQHAHQKLIVHRDLKPSNILITVAGVPKLLDFGIAKLLDPTLSPSAVTRTLTALRMMTPDYASPEQVRGLPVTTASDVYSLGAVLYELLTGARPHQFDTYSPAEIERIVCETAVERPSTAVARATDTTAKLHRHLTGDLDNIVLMALRKEPERRYQSVEQLAEDLRRYLTGRPISARRESIAYRTGKFLRRNKLGVAASLLVLCSLIGALVVSNYQTRRAERRFQQVRKLANTFLFDFHNEIKALPGATKARALVIRTALEYLDSLSQEARGDAALQLELAEAYVEIAKVQGDTRQGNLGQTEAALASYRKAISLVQAITGREQNLAALRCLSRASVELGDLQVSNGDLANGIATLQQGIPITEQLYARSNQELEHLMPAIWAYEYLGDAQMQMGDVTAALNSYRRALRLGEERAAKFPNDAAQHGLALEHERIGDALAKEGDLAGTLEYYRRALQIREELVKRRPNDAPQRRNLMVTYNWLGNHLGHPEQINWGEPATARDYFRRGLAIVDELAAADAQNKQILIDRALGYSRWGLMLTDTAPPQAVAALREALTITQAMLQEKPDDYTSLRLAAQAHRRLAAPLQKLGDRNGALHHLQQALATLQKLTDQGKATAEIRAEMQRAHLALADRYLRAHNLAQASAHYQQAQALAEKELAAKPQDLYALWASADVYDGWAQYHAAHGADKSKVLSERRASWRASCQRRQQALDAWRQWNQQAKPNPFGPARQEQAARAVAQCDAALAKLPIAAQR